MKIFTSITAIIAASAAATASQVYQPEHYNTEIYQSQGVEQHAGVYPDQSQHGYGQRPLAEKTARILNYHSENNGHNYQYAYETENGIKAQEAGHVTHGTAAEGAFSYTGDDGHTYTVTYTADEYGFRPQGAHLPTPPPIPDAILKSLEQNARDEASGISDDGHYRDEHQAYYNEGYQQEGYAPAQHNEYHH